MNKYLIFSMLLLGAANVYAQKSPNGIIKVEAKNEEGLVVNYSGKPLYKVNINVKGKKPFNTQKYSEVYDMRLGKRSHCENACNEAKYKMTDGKTLVVRAYNDGVVWRTIGGDIKDVTLDMSSAKNSWLQKWTEPYEFFYDLNVEEAAGKRWAYPSLFEYNNDVFVLITESAIEKYNSSSCLYSADSKGVFRVVPDNNEVECQQSPWHVSIIGSKKTVVESTLVTDVAPANRIGDASWVKLGVASWVYWAYNHGSNDFNIIKKYVDMAKELHLPYVLIDAEWDEMKDGKTVEDAIRYARECNVDPIIWYNSSVGWIDGAPGPKFRLNKPEDREKEFAWCEKVGVKGVKIDFFSGDNQKNMQYMIELLESAAKHHLTVNFHGATLPRGWQRTYPNLVSTEGVYGAEWYNNVPTFTTKAARHNATLPFTRNVVGSMDYTPCAFTDSQHPHITTHAHELALTCLFESGVQHLADRPESFLAQPHPVKDYLGMLPTAWDETRFIDGYPGEYVVMARRKGDKWFIAGINGTDNEKVIPTGLASLSGDKHNLYLFEDGDSKENPWKLRLFADYKDIPSTITCKPRGGFVLVVNFPESRISGESK
ncbi:MAG: glycoside hydrolase family 97 catalytic domain-containing protein [Bacteroidaceae bacterium]|nr:glycoside hydrolase family 97 catalytic domain-containing protein [Bacteroidaceae bacterium]